MNEPADADFAQFSREFRRRAVTEERVAAAMAALASRELRFGPYAAGPLASVSAAGTVGTARVRTVDADAPSFAVTLPATLDLAIRLGALSRLQTDIEIDLVLTPRPADGLFLFIDAAPVRAGDIRIALRGRGLGVAVSGIASGLAGGLPSAITDEVRRQVARQIGNALRASASRRARTIDIAARVDRSPRRRPPAELDWVSDADFGRQFVTRAVSVTRVVEGLAGLAGLPVDIGPLEVGPGGIADVRATGAVGTARVTRAGAGADFAVELPLQLDLVVGLVREHRYRVDVTARLRALARPADEARIVIDVPKVARDDVTVTVAAADRVAAMLGRVGRIADQIAAQVRRTVNERIADTDRVVDIGAILEGKRRPRPRPGPSAEVAGDESSSLR